MTDRILEKYTGKRPEDGGADSSRLSDAESLDDLGSFGWLRGIRDRAIMLELRKRSGDIMAIGYGWLERAEFNASEGITLHVMGHKIRIKGRNLNMEVRPTTCLFEGIARHRVPWIQEADEPTAMRTEEKETLIDAIEW